MAKANDTPAVLQRASKPHAAATPSSFDNFMLKMRKKAEKERFPAQASPKADKAYVQDDMFFTPEARGPARLEEDKSSIDEITSNVVEPPGSRMGVREDFGESRSSLNIALLNSGLPPIQLSSSSKLKAVKHESSLARSAEFSGPRPLPPLPNRPKNVERPTEPPFPLEARPETPTLEPIRSHKTPTAERKQESPANAATNAKDLEAHIAKLQNCLEIHTLLLTRVNALPIDDDSPIISQLHGYLSSCERRLHYLLRNAPGSAFRSSASSSLEGQQELAEQCFNTLEMVMRETLAVEARNAGEISAAGKPDFQDLEAAGGEDVGSSGSGSWGRSETSDPGKLSPEKVNQKKRRGHRGPRKSKSRKNEAAVVGDEQHSESEEEDVWQGGVSVDSGRRQ